MQVSRPLHDTHPEFSVRSWATFCEYRVENWHLARDGSGRIVSGVKFWTWLDPLLVGVISLVWSRIRDSQICLVLLGLAIFGYIWSKCNQVIHESVFYYPPLGIQLETHRGPAASMPMFISRNFIPLSYLEDFIINEGLHRWNVRYYLVAVKRSSTNELSLEVAFENILPHFPILLQVYQGIQNVLSHSQSND